MGIINFLKGLFRKMFKPKSINEALRIEVLTTDEQVRKIELWRNVYEGKAEWNNGETPSLNIAQALCAAVSMGATIESESELQGNDFLNKQYQGVFGDIRDILNKALAVGSVVLRPFVYRDKILVNTAENGEYFPVRYDVQGNLESAVFVERQKKGENFFTLLSFCDWTDGTYTITNRAFSSKIADTLGSKVNLSKVAAWANIEPTMTFNNISRPWFVPLSTPDGKSIFKDAINKIKQADVQDSREEKEYDNAQSLIFVPPEMTDSTKAGELSLQKKRMFVKGAESLNIVGNEPITIFNPNIRDYHSRTERLIRQIEFAIGVSYGTISDPQSVERTATEIKSSRQKSFTLYSSLQKEMEKTFSNLAAVMREMAVVYGLDGGEYEQTFHWNDSILITEEEKQKAYSDELDRLMALLDKGIVTRAEVRAFVKENSDYFHKITPDSIAESEAELPEDSESEWG